MKKLRKLQKGLAMLLILAIVAGLVPDMSGGANKVQSATGTGTEPSVSAYATKEQLMDGTFAPNADGTAANYGKIVFGKKSDGKTSQEWHILGKDEGVLGDNTIIFAASPIATKRKFEDAYWGDKTESSLWSDCDYSGRSITKVHANHYGASDLRVELKGMATNTSYFTTAEQDLMNATTVTTYDYNNGVNYTTTDKLYALHGEFYNNNKVWAGTSNSTVLAGDRYWSEGSSSKFWLRSPDDYPANSALFANPDWAYYVDSKSVNNAYDVRPASNLNLSSVLFASSAKAASSDTVSGTLTDGTAMTLRLNGTGKDIGTVIYYNATGVIKATKGSTSQTVALVVQGNDGTNNWYYSKKIDKAETVNASDIKSALNLSSDIDLSACKIWLEITDTDGMIYAVGATEEELSITSVEITDIDTPVSNTALDTEASCATTGVSSTTPQVTWTPGDSTAVYNTSYTASITLTAGTGYKFIDSTTATVLGNTATSVKKNEDGTLTVTYAFPVAKDKWYTYVTKTQLMDGTFAPNAYGTTGNYGKIVFGKKSDGTTAQEWYILGKDAGVSGDNTIIFASSPIATGQVFEDDYLKIKAFQPSFGVYASDPLEVCPNHYGASDLRVALQGMATNTSCFTAAEQDLMNATTVTTNDVNNGVTYTTTDKLYALQGDWDNNKKLWAGTSDSTVLAMSSYWSSGSWFWTRSHYTRKNVLVARPVYSDVYHYYADDKYDVQPASNLNLSSVLFASSAKAASSDTAEAGPIAEGTAMTLRLNGIGKNIGTVTYNTTTGDIKVAKGSTSQTVALIVQGNAGANDWYYSKKIDKPETVNALAIKSELSKSAPSLSSDIDLSDCKIWLETTDSTENLIYAVGATEPNITSVEITGIDTPVSNTALDTEAACTTTGVSSTTPQIKWTPSDSTAGYNISYTASITLTADTCYEFMDSTTATVLGNTATSVKKNEDGTLTVTYIFSATKDKLISIKPPQAITVANGTAYYAMNLPATVNIVTEGNSKSSAQVTWDTTTPASGSYDPAVLTEQTVTLNGTVDCPDNIDANGVSLTTTITITISMAVVAPPANPPANPSEAPPANPSEAPPANPSEAPSANPSEAPSANPSETPSANPSEAPSANPSETPSATPTAGTYATKTQLMDGTFAPNEDGTAVNYGKIVFGKKSDGTTAQEWYILGKDAGVSGDNTIIFAASPIATGQVFENDESTNKAFQSSFGVYASDPSEVYPNHYGASDLRVALQDMAKNTNYFTTAEQGLMNATTVKTNDKNNKVTYTTTDKLYALQGNSIDDRKKLWAGTSDSTVLAMSSYWSNGNMFWLRSPYNYTSNLALLALPGSAGGGGGVDYAFDVRPASNLNLSSVLFASAATAASSDTAEAGPIAEGTAMTLRFDGTGKNIGTVTYNATTGDIKATKGSTEGDVVLVVQSNDETNDWYFSKQITGPETVNASDIKSALNLSSDIDLSACKIWLEITDSTENLIYAVGATEEVLSITSVEITGRILTDTGGSIEGNMTGLANYKLGQDVTLTVPVIAGYNFVGWYEYSESSANEYTGENLCTSRTYTFTAEADRNLVAVYKPIGSANLTIDGGKDFTINGDNRTTEVTNPYPLGSQIEVVCNDSDFEYWKNSAGMVVSRDKSYTFTVTGKETISAVFNTIAENKATVVFESYYGQVIARDQYAAGATLTETPGLPFRYGYTALGWDYNGDGTYDTSEGTEDTFAKALERGFASDDKLVKILPVYQLKEVTYQITVENGTGAGTYKQNDVVTVVANAASEGNKFSHWADDAGNILSYNEKYQFYAAKDITVTAVYVADAEKVEAKGTTEIVDKYADKANGKLTFVSMSTVPEGCTIDKAGIIATNVESVGTSGDGFNASTAKIVRGNSWSGDAYRYTWSIKMSAGQTCYVRAYLVYTDAEGNVNTVYGKTESLTMPE